MNALVTGITGFAGGFLAEHLLASGDRVLGASRGRTWPTGAPAALRDAALLAWPSIADPAGPTGLLAAEEFDRLAAFAPDAIFHLAAMSVPEDCGPDEPAPAAWAANVEGTRRVCELAATLPSRPKLIFASTSHVYAPAGARDVEPPPLDEAAPLGPRRGYGKTKLAAEGVVREFLANGRIAAVIARAFQHTGPRQSARMMLPQWCERIVRGGDGPLTVFNRDTQIDLTDVRDVVRAYRLLAERGSAGQTYNVGSGVSRRTGGILQSLLEQADCRRKVVEERPGRRYDPIANVERLRAATGWRPEIPLERTIAETLAYWRQGPPCE